MCYHDSNFLVSRKLYITRTNLGMISSTYIVWILSLLGNISDPYIHLGCFYFFFELHFDSWIFDSNLLWWFLFMKHVSISYHSIYIHLFLSWQCFLLSHNIPHLCFVSLHDIYAWHGSRFCSISFHTHDNGLVTNGPFSSWYIYVCRYFIPAFPLIMTCMYI